MRAKKTPPNSGPGGSRTWIAASVLTLSLLLAGCSMLGGPATGKQAIEPWPLPPKPTGIDPGYRDDGDTVCLPRRDFGAILGYIVDLRQAAMDHGAVKPTESATSQ